MMMPIRAAVLAGILVSAAAIPTAGSTAQKREPDGALDAALQVFWAADDPLKKARAIEGVLATRPEFEELWARLEAGRSYSPDVATGRVVLTRSSKEGVEHHHMVVIPEHYDPRRKYPVRFYLHGDVQRPAWQPDGNWWRNYRRIAAPERIAVFPSSWRESRWWQESQVKNLAAILDGLKRTYNIDENRVHLIGASDGGTGVYFQAFRASTQWAAFLPFISNPIVLTNPRIGVDGQIYVVNLTNKPFFAVNGGRDPLYPPGAVIPFMELFKKAGVPLQFRMKAGSGHTTRWWPEEAAAIDSFIDSTPRNPLPDHLAWETERTDRYDRIHWLLITELGSVEGESSFKEFNSVIMRPPLSLGVKMDEGSTHGVRLVEVESRSPAGSAGLRTGDLIVEAGGAETPTPRELRRVLSGYGFGSSIPVTIVRDGGRRKLTLRVPEEPAPRSLPAFPHAAPSGRIELERRDNTVRVRCRGVRRYMLLLSPEQFDFSKPLRVFTNDAESFNGDIAPDVRALLKWAARDNDRTMLFGAELEIDVAGR
ncbi:MAG: PDZ domain-containing protein [Acidobacteriota bacterium]